MVYDPKTRHHHHMHDTQVYRRRHDWLGTRDGDIVHANADIHCSTFWHLIYVYEAWTIVTNTLDGEPLAGY
jgi:hypothetical protein